MRGSDGAATRISTSSQVSFRSRKATSDGIAWSPRDTDLVSTPPLAEAPARSANGERVEHPRGRRGGGGAGDRDRGGDGGGQPDVRVVGDRCWGDRVRAEGERGRRALPRCSVRRSWGALRQPARRGSPRRLRRAVDIDDPSPRETEVPRPIALGLTQRDLPEATPLNAHDRLALSGGYTASSGSANAPSLFAARSGATWAPARKGRLKEPAPARAPQESFIAERGWSRRLRDLLGGGTNRSLDVGQRHDADWPPFVVDDGGTADAGEGRLVE